MPADSFDTALFVSLPYAEFNVSVIFCNYSIQVKRQYFKGTQSTMRHSSTKVVHP